MKKNKNPDRVVRGEHRDEGELQKRLAELRERGRVAPGYAPSFLFEAPGDEIEGTIVDFRGDIGKFSSTLVTIKREDNSHAAVWLGADLAMKIKPEDIGKHVVIVYLDDLDTGEGNPMRQYEVVFLDGARK